MNREEIRKALDHFENDEYVDAKEIIKREVAGKRDIFLKDKIGLQNPINPVPDANADANADDDDNNQGDE